MIWLDVFLSKVTTLRRLLKSDRISLLGSNPATYSSPPITESRQKVVAYLQRLTSARGRPLLMTMVTALTVLGASNINDSSYATSERVLDCQHLASSKFAPSLEVRTFTCPGA